MSRRVLPLAHSIVCRLPVRRVINVNRTRTLVPAASACPSRALHGTTPLLAQQQQQEEQQQQQEQEQEEDQEAEKAPPAASTAGSGGEGMLGSLPARTAFGRVGRGVLIGLPVVGAGFALQTARRDFRRARSELKGAHVRHALAEMSYRRDVSRTAGGAARQKDGAELPERPTLETSAARCFGVTAAIDSGVVAAHALTLYGLYQGWEPDPIVNSGVAAMVGAVFSTGGGVRGEYLVAHREFSGSGAKGSPALRRGDGGDAGGVAHAAAEEREKAST